MSTNITHATNDYIHKILQEMAMDHPRPLLAPGSKQGSRPASLFKAQPSGAFAPTSGPKGNSALGNKITR